MNWAVVMAGGNGTRFWPLSNSKHPKQFLRLLGGQTPAETCVQRLARVVPMSRILIVASESHRESLAEALPDFPAHQVLWEPVGRNTAACIAWANEAIRAQDPQAVIGVFPSDHAISDEAAFAQCLEKAYAAAAGRIVLFGIEPTRPETGYGYIREGVCDADGISKVASFLEKPDLATAVSYLEDGKYLWNSGMFIFDANVMHEELALYVPQIVEKIEAVVKDPSKLADIFPTLLSISIDYAVMEHTKRAAVMRASFPWDDLGTWASIRRYYPADAHGNAACGAATLIDCHDTFAYADDGRVIAALGMNHVVIVSTREAVLVLDADRAQEVRKIVDSLKNK
ncbi:MAG: mannose-1-phosphate guanylyltransferase [Proteobacteria bacterium]|nr:mannose-1-phosphate guanylyltransferase [Pseudomonadota bacterium]